MKACTQSELDIKLRILSPLALSFEHVNDEERQSTVKY